MGVWSCGVVTLPLPTTLLLLLGAAGFVIPCRAIGNPSPVKRVLNILHGMSERVASHTHTEDALFDERMCFCKKQGASLEQAVAVAQEKLPQLMASVEDAKATGAQLESDIQQHNANRDLAEKTILEQDALRKSESQSFNQLSIELSSNIKSLASAIAALRSGQGQGAALLQNRGTLEKVRIFAQTINPDRLREADREQMASLLETLEQSDLGAEDSTSDVGEIVGMLQQMLDNMKSDLAKMQQAEEAGTAQHGALTQAKKKEVQTLSAAIQEKQDRLSNTQVESVQLKKQLESTRIGLETDRKLLSDLKVDCNSRKDEHTQIIQDLNLELSAIREAIEILQSNQATLVLTEPSPQDGPLSFVQLASAASSVHAPDAAAKQIADMIQQLSMGHAAGDKFSLLAAQVAQATTEATSSAHSHRAGHALRGRTRAPSGLEKVSKLVAQMLELLGKEQEDDDLKKQMCVSELKRENENIQTLNEEIAAKAADLATTEEQHNSVAKDMESLRRGIEALDKSVAEDTEQRKRAHDSFAKMLADNHAAIDLLRLARRRLESIYGTSSLAQAPAQTRPASDSVEVDELPGELVDVFDVGASDTRQSVVIRREEGVLSQQSARQPKLKGEGNGVVKMLAQIESDLQKESKDAQLAEDADQKEYERMLAAAAAKREADAKAIADRAAIVAELSESANMLNKRGTALRDELKQSKSVVSNLKAECDWLLEHYDQRKRSRSDEKYALSKALQVLTGANYGLVQQRPREGHVRQHNVSELAVRL